MNGYIVEIHPIRNFGKLSIPTTQSSKPYSDDFSLTLKWCVWHEIGEGVGQ